jgi:hypothetical protein
MKVLGYGWIKAGDTLNKAMEQYGVAKIVIKDDSELTENQKILLDSINDVKKDVKKSLQEKEIRKSAKPRYFRVILEEVEL